MSSTSQPGQCAPPVIAGVPLPPTGRKSYCRQACADRHLQGQRYLATDGESGVSVAERPVSDSQLDGVIEETFPASDPISP
jgi:hypothetical protein